MFPIILLQRCLQIVFEVISENQSAFIPGRVITNNIVIGHGCIHAMKKNHTGSIGLAALKLDMSKAYNRVKLIFLEKMMVKMGFHPR